MHENACPLLTCRAAHRPRAVHAHDSEVTPKPKLLQNGLPIEQLAADPGELQVFEIVIPPDVIALKFGTSGGKGDCDIYVRHDVHPTDFTDYDAKSTNGGNIENVTDRPSRSTPATGMCSSIAFSPFHGVSLKATYALAPDAPSPFPRLLSPGARRLWRSSADGARLS